MSDDVLFKQRDDSGGRPPAVVKDGGEGTGAFVEFASKLRAEKR